jgi:hypothetical protein
VTFETPLLLLALAAAPLAWLLGRLRRRRVRVEVASLLLWERVAAVAGEPPARERRRILDARALAEMGAVAALVLAGAGPRLAGARPRRVAIVVDETPSMHARDAAGGDRIARASALRAEIRGRLGPADEARDLGTLEEARLADVDAVYFLTDHDAPAPWGGPPRFVPVIVGGGGPNAGIVAAGGRIAPDGALEVVARVEGTARDGLPEAGPKRIAPAPAGPVTVRIPAGDALALDDAVTLLPPEALPAVRISGAVPDAVRRALAAAGAVLSPGGEVRVAVESAAEADRGTGPRLAIAPEPGQGPPPERLARLATPLFRFADPAAQRLAVAPAPPPPDLRAVLVDERGRVAIGYREEREGTLVWVGIPLGRGDAATDWARDRSFPLFFAEALRGLAPRTSAPDGLWRATGVLSAAETREAGPVEARPLSPGEPLPAPNAEAARDVAGYVLAAGGGLILLAWALARERSLPAEASP